MHKFFNILIDFITHFEKRQGYIFNKSNSIDKKYRVNYTLVNKAKNQRFNLCKYHINEAVDFPQFLVAFSATKEKNYEF